MLPVANIHTPKFTPLQKKLLCVFVFAMLFDLVVTWLSVGIFGFKEVNPLYSTFQENTINFIMATTVGKLFLIVSVIEFARYINRKNILNKEILKEGIPIGACIGGIITVIVVVLSFFGLLPPILV